MLSGNKRNEAEGGRVGGGGGKRLKNKNQIYSPNHTVLGTQITK